MRFFNLCLLSLLATLSYSTNEFETPLVGAEDKIVVTTQCKNVCTKKNCVKVFGTSICTGGHCFKWCAPKVSCATDTKRCENGSNVGRDPKNGCEFKQCPVCTQKSIKCTTKRICHGPFCFNIPQCGLQCVKWSQPGLAAYEGEVVGIENAADGCKNICTPKHCWTFFNIKHCVGGICIKVCPPACPKDLKKCDDGSSVGRVYNSTTKKCEFKKCPVCVQRKFKCVTKRVCHKVLNFSLCHNLPKCYNECIKYGPAPSLTENGYMVGGFMIGVGLLGSVFSYFYKKRRDDVVATAILEEIEPLV